MSNARPIIRQRDEGEHLWFAGGGLWTLKASAAETGGALLLTEFQAEKGKVTPLHFHPNEDEGFYVLEGEVLIHIDGREHKLGQGGIFNAPRGVPHAFMVVSDMVRMLCWQTPATGEPFYRRVTEPATPEEALDRPPDWNRLRAAAQDSPSIEILGPAPFAAAQPVPAGAAAS